MPFIAGNNECNRKLIPMRPCSTRFLISLVLAPCSCSITKVNLAPRPCSVANINWCQYGFENSRPPRPFGQDDLARISRDPLLSSEQCKEIIAAATADGLNGGWSHTSAGRYGTPASSLPALLNIVDVVSEQQLVTAPTVCQLLNDQMPKWEPLLHGLFCGTSSFESSISALRLKFARIVKCAPAAFALYTTPRRELASKTHLHHVCTMRPPLSGTKPISARSSWASIRTGRS